MPDRAYEIARGVARQLTEERRLTPPWDLDALVGELARLVEDEIPASCDGISLHGSSSPIVVVQRALVHAPERRRLSIAHQLGHVLLGWHQLGTPCDISRAPAELPVTVHDLVEGEASAFARELLAPESWIESFNALDRPAELVRHVAERGGIPAMSAARCVARLLPAGRVWVIVDEWDHVIDSGRSPGTVVRPPAAGSAFDGAPLAREAAERHRALSGNCIVHVWAFTPSGERSLPHDRSAREVGLAIARDLGVPGPGADGLIARIDGVAGWANERHGTLSTQGMQRALNGRFREGEEFAPVVAHADFPALVEAKSRELVAKRISRV